MSEEFLDGDDLTAFREANELTSEQLHAFYTQVEKEPSMRAPITGKACRLGFEFMEDTGLRITEMLHVKKGDINFKTRIITVTHPKSEKTCKCSTWKYKDLRTRRRVLEKSDKNCKLCHGKGKWKKPQRTTFTPRFTYRLFEYCQALPRDDDLLFPTTRQSFWVWGKRAGIKAGINIFQQKEERQIEGIFLHLFRALCSKRMIRDAEGDPYKDQLIATKLRHSVQFVTDRYTKIDINYLIGWERRTYE
jgi:integrase